jgi:hypothetical protein
LYFEFKSSGKVFPGPQVPNFSIFFLWISRLRFHDYLNNVFTTSSKFSLLPSTSNPLRDEEIRQSTYSRSPHNIHAKKTDGRTNCGLMLEFSIQGGAKGFDVWASHAGTNKREAGSLKRLFLALRG